MILRLVIKDIRAFGPMICVTILGYLLVASFFTVIENSPPWRPYIVIGSVQIVTVVGTYLVFAKRSKEDMLLLSLPIPRSTIVISKYATAACLVCFCSILWYGHAHFLRVFFDLDHPSFQLFHTPAIWLILITFYCFLISLFIPLFSGLRQKWILFIIFLPIAFVYVKGSERLLRGKGLEAMTIEPSIIVMYAIIIGITILVTYGSIKGMIKMIETKEV